MTKRAACTIISKNYISFARVLAKSYLEHNETPFYVLVVDADKDAKHESFEVLTLEDISLPNPVDMQFKYDVTEFNTAVKPFLLSFLLHQGYETAVYFDPDIYITSELEELFNTLENNSLVLTPHILTPYQDDDYPSELDFLKTGIYNLGFIGVANTPDSHRFLTWWQNRLKTYCYVDKQDGLFVDQRWVDFAPALCDDVGILRDAGYNMAYWNLHERELSEQNGCYFVNQSTALKFFHFSGLDANNLEPISKYQNRFTLSRRPDLKPMFETYAALLFDHDYQKTISLPYGYATFDNGRTINSLARRLYPKASSRFHSENPFQVSPNSYYRWLEVNALLGSTKPQKAKSKTFAKVDERFQGEYQSQFKLITHGLALVKRVIGLNRYLKLLKFLGFISSTRQQHYIFLEPEKTREADRAD